MYKIGITGSIGTGKTTIANMFAMFNIPKFDADKEIRNILSKENVKRELSNIWPTVVKKNNVDKQKLKSIIFSNEKEKTKLEKLLYPFLEIELKKFEKLNYRREILVYDVPLIYETKSQRKYDLILLTNCNLALQRKRVMYRDGISNSLFEKITKSQLSFSEKEKFNPKIINTNNIKLFILIRVILLLIGIKIRLKIKNEGRKKTNT